MKLTYSGPKRILSCLLVMLLLLAFPATAMAADGETNYYAVHLQLDDNGQYTYNVLDGSEYVPFGVGNLTPATPMNGVATWMSAGETIDLWPTSSAMREAGVAAGTTVPYVEDSTGNTWYLQKIQ